MLSPRGVTDSGTGTRRQNIGLMPSRQAFSQTMRVDPCGLDMRPLSHQLRRPVIAPDSSEFSGIPMQGDSRPQGLSGDICSPAALLIHPPLLPQASPVLKPLALAAVALGTGPGAAVFCIHALAVNTRTFRVVTIAEGRVPRRGLQGLSRHRTKHSSFPSGHISRFLSVPSFPIRS